jgi:hypothetical protein
MAQNPTDPQVVEQEVAAPSGLPIGALRERWKELFGNAPTSTLRREFLIKAAEPARLLRSSVGAASSWTLWAPGSWGLTSRIHCPYARVTDERLGDILCCSLGGHEIYVTISVGRADGRPKPLKARPSCRQLKLPA